MIRGSDTAPFACNSVRFGLDAFLSARVSARELTGLSRRGALRSSGSLSCASLYPVIST